MAKMTEVKSTTQAVLGTAPGEAIIVTTDAGIETRDTEMFQAHGFSSAPTEGDAAVEIKLDAGHRVLVASHNYRMSVPTTAGETVVYATDESGDAVTAEVRLSPDGAIKITADQGIEIESAQGVKITSEQPLEINGNSSSMVKYQELQQALQALETALKTHMHPTAAPGPPSPPSSPITVDISPAEAKKVKTA